MPSSVRKDFWNLNLPEPTVGWPLPSAITPRLHLNYRVGRVGAEPVVRRELVPFYHGQRPSSFGRQGTFLDPIYHNAGSMGPMTISPGH